MPEVIKVEVKNEILGDGIFWVGVASDINEIRNIVAKKLALLVAKDGISRSCGMWHVFMFNYGKEDAFKFCPYCGKKVV